MEIHVATVALILLSAGCVQKACPTGCSKANPSASCSPDGDSGDADTDTDSDADTDTEVETGSCDGGAAAPDALGRDSVGDCVAPLTCSPCPSEAQARSCASDTAIGYEETQCCGLTVIACQGGYGGFTYFFDEASVLVSILGYTDSPYYCESETDTGSFTIWYGEKPPDACR